MPVSSSEPAGRGNGDLLGRIPKPRGCESRIAAAGESASFPLDPGRPREPPVPQHLGGWGCWLAAGLGGFLARLLQLAGSWRLLLAPRGDGGGGGCGERLRSGHRVPGRKSRGACEPR